MSALQTVLRPTDRPLDETHLRAMLAELGEDAPPPRRRGRRSRRIVSVEPETQPET